MKNATKNEAYSEHIKRMLSMLDEKQSRANASGKGMNSYLRASKQVKHKLIVPTG
jgi:hypothetical protein